MEKAILVAYASNAGSTADVARAIGEELAASGARVEVRQISELAGADLTGYRAFVIGAPMILGWHRDAARFLKANRQVLSSAPVALFVTAMRLTKTDTSSNRGVPVTVDERAAKLPRNPGRMGLKERYARVNNYLGQVLKAARGIKPVDVAFFGGKLDFGRLKTVQLLFVMLLVGAQPGDCRNWDAIRAWARKIQPKL